MPFKTVAEKYSSSDVSTILLTDEKIYGGHTEKPKESPTLCNCSNQEERRRDKTLAHTISLRQSTLLPITSPDTE